MTTPRPAADEFHPPPGHGALVFLALAAAPLYGNDVLFLASRTIGEWLAVDYGSKVLALGVLAAAPPLRGAVLATLALRCPRREAVGWAVLAAIAIVGLDRVTTAIKEDLGDAPLWSGIAAYPAIDDPVLRAIDLSFGLILTALSEELLFRGVLGTVGARYVRNRIVLSVLAALAFALIHWSLGAVSLAFAFAAGVILMALFWRTGSTIPGIVVHYVVNLIAFA